jgi:hypothetical protein
MTSTKRTYPFRVSPLQSGAILSDGDQVTADQLPAPQISAELINAVFATEGTCIAQDTKTGDVTFRRLTDIADKPRWIVVRTRDDILATAAAAVTAAVAQEWAL